MPSAHQEPATHEPGGRNAAIVEARTVEGLSYPEIGRRFGISKERARQILRGASKVQGDAERREQREEVAAAFAVETEAVADEIARLVPGPAMDLHPPTTLRLALVAGRAAGFTFEEAWAVGAAAALSKLPPGEASDWREVFASTRQGWADAYEGRGSPLASLPRPWEDR